MYLSLLKYHVNITFTTIDLSNLFTLVYDTRWDLTLYALWWCIEWSLKVDHRPINWAKEIHHDHKAGEKVT